MWLRLSPQSVAGYSTSLFCFPRRAPLVFADDLGREPCDATREGEATMKLPRRQFLHLAGAAVVPAISRISWAQAYPTRPVRVIVPFAPAGDTDLVARLMGQWLSERLGQPFIIENRPGAGTNIGTEAVVRAPADGYTLLLASPPSAINATLYDKLNFVFLRDIAPVAGVIRAPFVSFPKIPSGLGVASWAAIACAWLRKNVCGAS